MEYSKLIGIKPKSFTTPEGKTIEGADAYLTRGINPERGQGEEAERIFLSKAKLAALDFKPTPGQTVEVFYNRYGKVETMRLVDDTVDVG